MSAYMTARPRVGHYEVKQTRTDSISFNCLEQVQEESLPGLEENHMYHKYSDADPRQKVCDFSVIPPLPAYVIIKFPKIATFIRIDDFLQEKKVSERKSLTVQRAKELAEWMLEI